MKRIISVLFVSLMLFALCVPAMADEPLNQEATTTNDGKIVINNATVGEEYKIYQLAVLESFSATSYSYWLAPDEYADDGVTLIQKGWRDFFTTDAAKKFFNVSVDGYLTTTGNTLETQNKENMAADALAYIQKHNIQPTDATNAEGTTATTLTFENLQLGYYFVDSSLGSICSLGTTNKTAYITDKNSPPTIVKEVQDDSGTAYGETNDADLFQDIQFRMIVDCKKGATNYVVHDTMTNMTFNKDSLKIYNGAPLDDNSSLLASDGTIYTLTENVACAEGTCTFHIEFKQSFLDTVTSSTDLYIYYTAALTENAVIGSTGNPNEVYLTYGNKQESTHDTTTTYTYEFQFVKTDKAGVYLSGATFTLWNAATGGEKINLVYVGNENEIQKYRLAKENETAIGVIELPNGKAQITGLDGRTTYYLQEEAAPQGYNKLTSRKEVVINSANLNVTPDEDPHIYSGSEGGIQIINQTGAILPETGGIGTTLFIVFGTIAVIGTGVLLFTKAKVAKEEE